MLTTAFPKDPGCPVSRSGGGNMEQNSHHLNYPAECVRLVKVLLERRRPPKEQQDDDRPDAETQSVRWAARKDFTVAAGERQINAYIQTWGIRSRWLYSLDFLYSNDEEHRVFHHYRARFSTPSPARPIQGTASVYFVVDISKIKPQTLPVEVRFVVESNRLVHTPGKVRFTEKWLADVIESKTLLRNAVAL